MISNLGLEEKIFVLVFAFPLKRYYILCKSEKNWPKRLWKMCISNFVFVEMYYLKDKALNES